MQILIVAHASAENMQMVCKHSFQGNYSGGDVLLKYVENSASVDKAYVKGKSSWVQICTDVETYGPIIISDLKASCSIFLPNWMNQRRKNFIWDFENKELHMQTLWRIVNPETNKKEWQWSYSVGVIGSKNWKVFHVWESEGVRYEKRKCK